MEPIIIPEDVISMHAAGHGGAVEPTMVKRSRGCGGAPFAFSSISIFRPQLRRNAFLTKRTAINAKSDAPTVFVAGATGNVGRRLVKTLADAGCRVRAGSREPSKCRDLVGDLGDASDLVEYVPFDVLRSSELAGAVSGSSVVVSTLGAAVSFGRVDGAGIANLMRAGARDKGVSQLIAVSSIGVGRPWALPAAILNLFGGVLLFKDFSEQVLRREARAGGKKYLIVRPGGMERPKDDFGDTHNVRIEARNTLANGAVSRMQIAELITAAVMAPEAADGKTVEVVAETGAPKVDLTTLLQNAKKD